MNFFIYLLQQQFFVNYGYPGVSKNMKKITYKFRNYEYHKASLEYSLII